MVHAEPPSGASEPRHDLVGDHEHPVAATDLDDLGPVVLARDRRRERGPGDRLGDERRDGVRAVGLDHPLQLGGVPVAATVGVRRVLAAVLVGTRRVQEPAEPRRVGLAERLLAREVERAERVAVVGGAPRDDRRATGLPDREVVGARHLDGGLHRLGPAAHRVDAGIVQREQRRQRRRRRPPATSVVNIVPCTYWVRSSCRSAASISDAVAVADADHDRAAGGVQVALPVGVGDPGSLGRDGGRQVAGAPARRRGSSRPAVPSRCPRPAGPPAARHVRHADA